MMGRITQFLNKTLVSTGLVICGILLTTACATIQSHPTYQQGEIIDLARHTSVPYSELRTALLQADVVYIGESHYTPSHIEAGLKILKTILNEGQTPVLGMEMFSWDGQSGIDRYLNGETTSIDTFLEESQWKNNWGGKYEEYSPLVNFAKMHQFKLLGLNPPRPVVRTVAKKGLAGIGSDPEVKKWNISDPFPPDDPEYRQVIYDQIEKCHGGMTPEVYQKVYEASVFRDEGMASVITTASKLDASGPTTFVSYTGAGHIQYGLPIPKRVSRQLGAPVRQITIYLHALDPEFPQDVDHLIEEQIADYVWLTALGPNGRQPRCGE